MSDYRKIWEESNGQIPVDEGSRSYEIHHINGNREDNRLENLRCVSIQEHYDIHLSQGDYGAAAAIAARMKVSPEELSRLSSLAGKQAYELGLGFHGMTEEERLSACSKGGNAMKGMNWYNNGSINIRSRISPGKDWVYGKLPCGSGVAKGTKLGLFWNNGQLNVRSEECPGDGWVAGKFLTEEQRERRREIGREKKQPSSILTCPHCGKTGAARGLKVWHFDRCKERII